MKSRNQMDLILSRGVKGPGGNERVEIANQRIWRIK